MHRVICTIAVNFNNSDACIVMAGSGRSNEMALEDAWAISPQQVTDFCTEILNGADIQPLYDKLELIFNESDCVENAIEDLRDISGVNVNVFYNTID